MPSSLARPAVEVEGAIRAWLRTTPAVGARWYFGAPLTPTFPLGIIDVTAVIPVPGGVPIDQATCRLDLWGAKATDRYSIASIAQQLRTTIDSTPSGTPMGPTAVCLGATVISGPRWQPDPDDGKARYSLTAEFLLRPAPPS